MIDLNNPFAASMFLAARPMFESQAGRAFRRFAASFVFAGAVGLVLVAGVDQLNRSLDADAEVTSAAALEPAPEFQAMVARIEAAEREEAALATGEASIR